jgi:hypothetical protein
MTIKSENYRERAQEVLRNMGREQPGAQDRQAMAAEAQAWATLAIAEAVTVAAESLKGELNQILKVFPKSLGTR